jgi:hypothetical protein
MAKLALLVAHFVRMSETRCPLARRASLSFCGLRPTIDYRCLLILGRGVAYIPEPPRTKFAVLLTSNGEAATVAHAAPGATAPVPLGVVAGAAM